VDRLVGLLPRTVRRGSRVEARTSSHPTQPRGLSIMEWGSAFSPGRVNRQTRIPGPTLQRSEARSQRSVASTVQQVQRFKDAIAQRSSPGLASCYYTWIWCQPTHPSPSAR
jgi:hypothetical protein